MNLVLVFMCLHTIKALFLSSEAAFTCSIIHKGPPQQVSPNVWFGRLFLHQMLFLWSPPERVDYYNTLWSHVLYLIKFVPLDFLLIGVKLLVLKMLAAEFCQFWKVKLCRKITVCLQGSDQYVLNPKCTELRVDKHKRWK